MPEQSRHPLEYLSILKRRHRWFLVPLAASCAVGVALALWLQTTFRSSATIAVQAPAVVTDLVQAQTGLNRTERLRALSQQLRSRAVLARVVGEEGLAGNRSMDEATQDLTSRISVEIPRPIARTQGEQELDAFDIVYLDRTAERAQRIADRLAHVFTEEHSRTREIQAEGTAEFLAAQVAASQQMLSRLEKQLRTAKELHMGALPEQTVGNLQTLAGLRQQLEATHNSILSERDRLALTDRQIQAMRKAGGSAATGASAAASPLQRVLALEGELSAARAKYTEKHGRLATGIGRGGHCISAPRRREQSDAAADRGVATHRDTGSRGHRSIPAARRLGAHGRAIAFVTTTPVRPRERESQAAHREALRRSGARTDVTDARRRALQRALCRLLSECP